MKLVSNPKKATILSFAVHNATRASRRPNIEGAHPQSGTQPGEKVSGIIVFEIPQSAQPKNLTYYDYTNRSVIEL
jgi:hypothetical protein